MEKNIFLLKLILELEQIDLSLNTTETIDLIYILDKLYEKFFLNDLNGFKSNIKNLFMLLNKDKKLFLSILGFYLEIINKDTIDKIPH